VVEATVENIRTPETVSDLILLRALTKQTKAARKVDRLDRSELLGELFQHYIVLRTELDNKLEQALPR
jgi:hypothetical protein